MIPDYFIKNSDGKQVAVYDKGNKNLLPIVFIHGNSLGAFTFEFQFSNSLSEKYRLISFDLPGHGNSERASQPEISYLMEGFINTILNVIDQLNLKSAFFAGHSLGGHLLLQGIERFNVFAMGYIIFGTPPLAKPPAFDKMYFSNPSIQYIFKENLDEQEASTLSAAFLKKDAILNQPIINSILKTDPLMRKTLGADLMSGNFNDEVNVVNFLQIPIAIIHGKDDQLVNPKYFDSISIPALWKNKINLINNAGHTPQFENPEEFNNIAFNFFATR